MDKKKSKDMRKDKQDRPEFKSKSDPSGSYTGTPLDGGKPVQDADDL